MLRIGIGILEPDSYVRRMYLPSAACENAQGKSTVVENERGIASPKPTGSVRNNKPTGAAPPQKRWLAGDYVRRLSPFRPSMGTSTGRFEWAKHSNTVSGLIGGPSYIIAGGRRLGK